jgi:DNA-binding IclR family transcriptional regulator
LELPLLANRYLAKVGIVDVCQPILDELARLSRELVRLAWRDGDRLVWIAEAQGASRGLRYDGNLGRVAALHATAVGKAVLARLPFEEAAALVRRQGLLGARGLGPKALTTMEALATELVRTARRGYAIAVDEGELGAAALAVALSPGNDPGRVVGSLAVVGPSVRMTRSRMTALAPDLQGCAARLSTLLRLPSICRRADRECAGPTDTVRND